MIQITEGNREAYQQNLDEDPERWMREGVLVTIVIRRMGPSRSRAMTRVEAVILHGKSKGNELMTTKFGICKFVVGDQDDASTIVATSVPLLNSAAP